HCLRGTRQPADACCCYRPRGREYLPPVLHIGTAPASASAGQRHCHRTARSTRARQLCAGKPSSRGVRSSLTSSDTKSAPRVAREGGPPAVLARNLQAILVSEKLGTSEEGACSQRHSRCGRRKGLSSIPRRRWLRPPSCSHSPRPTSSGS